MPLYVSIYIMSIMFCENLFTFLHLFVCVYVCVSVGRCTGAITCQWRSEVRSQFSPPTVGLPEAKLGLSDLLAGIFICRAILPALRNVSTVHTSLFIWTELLQTACSAHAFVATAFCFFPGLSGMLSGSFATSLKVISSGTFLRTLCQRVLAVSL